ncbi:MAG: metal ABC transporter permease [Gammaproteobacteria bacterium]|nr:metal ABC transporter permease [Gammaproteobacteria bacterium]
MNALELGILLPAFLAGTLVVLTHVPLGQEVLRRGIIFINLAVAQVAGLGVIASHSFGWETHGWEVQLAAISTALAGAFFLNWCERRWPDIEEAIIGVLFVMAATAGILLLANNPHAGEHLKELLVGQILWVTYETLIPVAVVYAFILAAWFTLYKRFGSPAFYALFAITVTLPVQLVGIYLVFASLIIPALATRKATQHRLWLGYALGLSGYAIGLAASAVFDLPTGAVIVWTLAVSAMLTAGMVSVMKGIQRRKN